MLPAPLTSAKILACNLRWAGNLAASWLWCLKQGSKKIGVHVLCDCSENVANEAKFLPPTRMQTSH